MGEGRVWELQHVVSHAGVRLHSACLSPRACESDTLLDNCHSRTFVNMYTGILHFAMATHPADL